MGFPRLTALKYFSKAIQIDFSKIISEQLLRKQARNDLWCNPLLIKAYSKVMQFVEQCRYAKYYDLFGMVINYRMLLFV